MPTPSSSRPPLAGDFIRDELHHSVGDGLNKALAALEETNTSLDGVLTHIDFNGARPDRV